MSKQSLSVSFTNSFVKAIVFQSPGIVYNDSKLRQATAQMQISEVAQHWQEFKDTGQIEVFETVSQALHVIEFITKKLFNVIC